MLKRAIRWRLIKTNPAAEAERPRYRQPELNILSQAEIARLWAAYEQLEHAAEPEQQLWWRLARTLTFTALTTGLRRGELLALRWKDIRLLEHQLQVREAIVKGRFTTPKSPSSRRLIELGPQTQQLLSRHWQQSAFQGDEELVFCHPQKGTPLDPSKLARCYLRPALRAAGIAKPFRPFHDLRHTALTHEAAAGNPMAHIQAQSRPLPSQHHRALHPRRPSQLPRRRRPQRTTAAQRAQFVRTLNCRGAVRGLRAHAACPRAPQRRFPDRRATPRSPSTSASGFEPLLDGFDGSLAEQRPASGRDWRGRPSVKLNDRRRRVGPREVCLRHQNHVVRVHRVRDAGAGLRWSTRSYRHESLHPP